ncbi:MAG TPA: hypothetical protein VG298_03590 [Acidimicrobiales bacterium]|nr:hypothetical protein [Acidimicrobiales bacterium]
MSESLEDLILDLLEWLRPGSRPYGEVMEAWRTSCPRLPVWEDANQRGLVEHQNEPGRGRCISVSVVGTELLQQRRGHGAIAS